MSEAAISSSAISRAVDDLKKFGGLQGRDIANIIGVSPATVSRWGKGSNAPTIDIQTTLNMLRWISERLAEFYEPDDVRIWLHSNHPQLKNEIPIELIRQGDSSRVLEVIDRLEDGVYL